MIPPMNVLLRVWLYAPFVISGLIALTIGSVFVYVIDPNSMMIKVMAIIPTGISYLLVFWPISMLFNLMEDVVDMFR